LYKRGRKMIGKVLVPFVSLMSLLIFISGHGYSDTPIQEDNGQPELNEILKKCSAYCEKLSNSVLYFVCLEKVQELIYVYGSSTLLDSAAAGRTEVRNRDLGIERWRDKRRLQSRNKYVNDYQLMRQDNKIKEVRQLIEENGKKLKPKYSELDNLRFKHEKIIMGPIALLNDFWQHYHDYRIVKKGKYRGDQVIILDVTPKPEYILNHLYGKVWVKISDGSIVKIEWSQKGIEGYDMLEAMAKAVQMEPRINLCTEYGYEKNGLRFPSKFTLEETYVGAKRKKVIKSKKVVEYENYKFFTVETEIKH
jgi:hypothetical protein